MRLSSLVVTLILVCASIPATCFAKPAAPQQVDVDRLNALFDKSVQDARHGLYLKASFGLLDQLGVTTAKDIKDPDLFDQWAQVMSCMTNAPTSNPAKGADFHVPARQIEELRAAKGVPAIDEIVRRARKTRIVILDENHLDPRQRAFALDVARALRPLGYSILAVEALKGDADDAASEARMNAISSDGYVREASGYYFDDPVFADFMRQSLTLGYKPIAY